jgi:hypothetical protein
MTLVKPARRVRYRARHARGPPDVEPLILEVEIALDL